MNDNERNKRIITVLTIFTILFTVMGGSLAYWTWSSENASRTNVAFSVGADFSCSADGGGDITEQDAALQPTTQCADNRYAIQRTIKVTPEIKKDNLTINMNLWLHVNSIDENLSKSENFRYALTTNPNSCTSGVVSGGVFTGSAAGRKLKLFNDVRYTTSTTDTYYLYIWLDQDETNPNTMNQKFDISLGGECTDYLNEPNAPVLDEGMIPVTINNNGGTVTTVSEDDPNWYDYENQRWANVVFVSETNRQNYLDNLANNVTVDQSDILAYYVWIPRYKYKIAQKCSDVENPTMEEYPECYAPYTVPEETRQELINHHLVTSETGCNGLPDDTTLNDFTEEEIVAMYYDADLWVDDCLNDGLCGTWYGENSFPKYVAETNNGIDDGYTQLEDCGYTTTTKLSYTASGFNGNNDVVDYYAKHQSIDIAFESESENETIGDASSSYITHPAFLKWDYNEGMEVPVSGIWVGKFETSVDPTSECYTSPSVDNCNHSDHSIRILPNVYSLRYQNISNQFYTAQNSDISDHMMTNDEWGVVAYLTHSKFGKNSEVYLNTNSTYLTGCGANGAYDSAKTFCIKKYGTETSYPQSTTGNITGIFDMSGGTREYVMANYGNNVGNSGFTDDELGQLEDYLNYFSETCTLATCGNNGGALNETLGWYSDNYAWFTDSAVWLRRGGRYDDGSKAGLFNFESSDGGAYQYTWRSVIW